MRTLPPIERVSRRRILGYGAASLAAAPAMAQQAPPQAQDTEAIAAGQDAATHLTIKVLVNGRGPFNFVVDTGADRSVIADNVAMALGLVRGSQVTVQGVVRSLNTQTVAVNDISFGPFRRVNLRLPVLSRTMLGADGYLGLDALDDCRVTLDFKNRALLIGPTRHATLTTFLPRHSAMVPLRGSMGHLRAVNCRVDGVNATAFIDTGAQVAVGNTRLFNALIDHDPDYMIAGTVPLTGVTGGEIRGAVTVAHRIRLNAVEFTDCTLVIADMQIFDLWGLSDQPALLIGMNFLRQFNQVSIDYGRKEILFDLASIVVAQRG